MELTINLMSPEWLVGILSPDQLKGILRNLL